MQSKMLEKTSQLIQFKEENTRFFEGYSGNQDAQTSGASKDFEWAPLDTNFVVRVSRPPC